MPRPVWQAFNQALAGRRKYDARYATEELGEGDEEDGRVAFIRVLERSAEYIKHIAKVQQVASANTPESNATEVTFSNLFDSLSMLDQEGTTLDDFVDAQVSSPVATSDIEEPYQPKVVFRVQVNKASDIRFQRH